MDYLLEKEVVYINCLITRKYGDVHSVIHPANLSSKLEVMRLKYENKSGKDGIIWKAAFWLHRMAHSGHVFCDGNKRTALATILLFLGRNGVYIIKTGYLFS